MKRVYPISTISDQNGLLVINDLYLLDLVTENFLQYFYWNKLGPKL